MGRGGGGGAHCEVNRTQSGQFLGFYEAGLYGGAPPPPPVR